MEETRVRKLADYFKKNLAKGYTTESLKWALIKQGYSRIEVEKAIDLVTQELAEEAPLLKEKPKITYQILDEQDKPVTIKKSWFKNLFE